MKVVVIISNDEIQVHGHGIPVDLKDILSESILQGIFKWKSKDIAQFFPIDIKHRSNWRVVKAFQELGIQNVEDLSHSSRYDFLKLPYFGASGFEALGRFMKEHKMKFNENQ